MLVRLLPNKNDECCEVIPKTKFTKNMWPSVRMILWDFEHVTPQKAWNQLFESRMQRFLKMFVLGNIQELISSIKVGILNNIDIIHI